MSEGFYYADRRDEDDQDNRDDTNGFEEGFLGHGGMILEYNGSEICQCTGSLIRWIHYSLVLLL
jgi:hypothetical protein